MISIKQLWEKMTSTDRKILVILLAIFLLFSYFLYDDSFFEMNQNLQLKSIGQVANSQNDVRKKYSKKFSWSKAKANDVIHTGDSLFTGNESEAKVLLKDGSEVSVRQNSLIVFNITEEEMNLDFKFGRFVGELTGNSKLNLESNGQKFEISGDNVKFEIKKDHEGKGLEITPLNGPLNVNSQKISKNEKLKVDRGAAKKEIPSEIVLSTSSPTKFSHSRFNTKLKLQWKSNSPMRRYELQVAKTLTFEDILFSEKIVKTHYSLNRYPNLGKFYVRVIGEERKSESQIISNILNFESFQTIGPEFKSPTPFFKKLVKTDEDGVVIEPLQSLMSWTTPVLGPYQIQIGMDYEFQNIVVDEKIESPPWLHTDLKLPGTYYARIRQYPLDNQEISWSQTLTFTYEAEPFNKLPAPELITKNIEYLAPNVANPRLEWTNVVGAKSYQVQISLDEEFKEIREFNSEKTEFKWQRYGPGLYYTRVAALTPKGKIGEWSAPGKLQIVFNKPIIDKVEPKVVRAHKPADELEAQEFKLRWTDFPSADLYEIEVAKDDSFAKAQKYEARSPASSVQIQKPGKYKVRVRAMSSNGTPLSPYSDPRDLSYKLKKILRPPEPLEPFNEATLFFQSAKSSQSFWFAWKDVEQAESYTIEISRTEDFANVLLTTEAKSPRYFNKKALPYGDLYWRVRANADDRTSEWSKTSKLTTYAGRRTLKERRLPASGGK